MKTHDWIIYWGFLHIPETYLYFLPTPASYVNTCCDKHFESMYKKEGKKDEIDSNVTVWCPATLTYYVN